MEGKGSKNYAISEGIERKKPSIRVGNYPTKTLLRSLNAPKTTTAVPTKTN
jgi:hypothetical protein